MLTSAGPWQITDLDVDGYLERVGGESADPSHAALADLHEQHVRAFTFDNIDVLLDQHPGVTLDAIHEKFVGRGRGGYCFEHATLFAAVLERLGYDVRRHLGRVGDPDLGTQQARTHMTGEVALDGERWLCDPGFGMSLRRPIQLVDGGSDDYLPGWQYRVKDTGIGWALERFRDGAWEVTHTTDELPVLPVDVFMGHHWTSTNPTSHFRSGLMIAKHLEDRHVTVTHSTVTVRVPGQPTEHRPLEPGELERWLDELDVRLTADERERPLARVAAINAVSD